MDKQANKLLLEDRGMGNYMERKILFLYPELSSLEKNECDEIWKLLTDIERIANSANSAIEEILCSHCFQTIKCKPSISMKVVDNSVTDFKVESNVRICIAKHGTTDYTSYYSKIIDEFKRETSEISHLVALVISRTETKINFHADPQNNFDALITVDLNHLDVLLESIMLDISLYHYFSLSTEPIKRKQFNQYKFSYIVGTFSSEMLSLYGGNLDKNLPIYLPISFYRMVEYGRRTKMDSKNETIRSLIADYADFLLQQYSYNYHYNENGSIPYDEKRNGYGSQVSDFVRNNSRTLQLMKEKKTFFVIFYLQDSSKKLSPLVIEYSEKKDCSDWIQHIGEIDCEYIIFHFSRGETI